MTSIYQHFRSDERDFIDQVLEWRSYVETNYAPKLTDFLDPRQQRILISIIGQHHEVKYSLFPESEQVERKRVLIYPDYYIPLQDDYNVALYKLNYPEKFIRLEHRQILGSILSLGIKREKFGDIILNQPVIQFMVAEEVSHYVQMHLNQIGKNKVSLDRVAFDHLIQSEEKWREKVSTVSSLRLDVIISSIYNISRQKAKDFITGGIVKVNWRNVEQVSFDVEEGDVLSVRGLGRSKLLSIEGRTKKEKWRIIAGLLN
ncbi:RNA-binding protein YlmH [Bacillus pakistanensis]|uniref:RNA-binding protein YlmH n=1 Tax=Rossellomorea pakistanensis TaxID=992288 RepID=A0ABS2NG02_9BACI|nr:RNA-binding protein [Bacillus pakistanensis]MBM7586758.1 RNA-binding protein YlmH [Bacillus pakistanensis]